MKQVFGMSIEIIDWEIGRAITTKNEGQIHLLSYKERIKRKGHSQDTTDDMIRVNIHEFVHICHGQYKNYKSTLVGLMRH